jgi:hypothetical protein
MRFERFLLDLLTLLTLLDRIVAMITSSFDLVSIYSFNLPDRCASKVVFRCCREAHAYAVTCSSAF